MKAQMFNYNQWVPETCPDILKKTYTEMLEKAGFNIITMAEHYFEPQGYTALFLLAESHLAIHTFPEENKSYVELSSCVKKQFDYFLELLAHERGEID